jgi:hypothetical protein
LFRRAGIAVQDGSTALLTATYPEWRELALPMVKWLVTEAGSDVKSERDDVREGLLAQRGAVTTTMLLLSLFLVQLLVLRMSVLLLLLFFRAVEPHCYGRAVWAT